MESIQEERMGRRGLQLLWVKGAAVFELPSPGSGGGEGGGVGGGVDFGGRRCNVRRVLPRAVVRGTTTPSRLVPMVRKNPSLSTPTGVHTARKSRALPRVQTYAPL